MTNFERIKNELTVDYVLENGIFCSKMDDRGLCSCNCDDCYDWLNEEFEECNEMSVELSLEEICILEFLDKKYKWIARDKNGLLSLYGYRPHKGSSYWYSHDLIMSFNFFPDCFKFVRWENEKPFEIKKLLEG